MELESANESLFNLTEFNRSEDIVDDPPMLHPYEETAKLLWVYFPPFFILLGTFGNIMTIVVLCRKSMWKMAFSPYLVVLSVADIVVLYTGLLRQWIRYLVGVDIREASPTACKVHIFSVYTFVDFSVWVLVAVSVERFIGICFPFKAKAICTRRRTQVTLLVIFLVLTGLNSHFFYGMGSVYGNSTGKYVLISHCRSLYTEYQQFSQDIWPWVDLCVFSLVPSCTIIVCNICLMLKVIQSSQQNRILPVDGTNTQRLKSSSMTALLISLNTLFLVSTAPISIYLIGHPKWSQTENFNQQAELTLWWAIVNVLMYMNNSVNFILYCVSGPRFRKEIKQICRRSNKVGVTISATPSRLPPVPMELSQPHVKAGTANISQSRSHIYNSKPDLAPSNMSPNSCFLVPPTRNVCLAPRAASVSSLKQIEQLPDLVIPQSQAPLPEPLPTVSALVSGMAPRACSDATNET